MRECVGCGELVANMHAFWVHMKTCPSAQPPAGADLRSIVELDMYTLPALRLLYRGSELLLADTAMEDHPTSVRNELHNYHCYLRAVLQSLGDKVP